MPYTLVKFALWFGLAALIGGVIGWLLRSLKHRSQLARSRPVQTDAVETHRLRQRVADLEQVAEERDRLRIQLAELRTNEATSDPDPEPVPVTDHDPLSVPPADTDPDAEAESETVTGPPESGRDR